MTPRCVHCGETISQGALICGECGGVQPPPGESKDWYRSSEYAVDPPDSPEEVVRRNATWGAAALGLALLIAVLLVLLPAGYAAVLLVAGVVWSVFGLRSAAGSDPGTKAGRAGLVLYGLALAVYLATLGALIVRGA